MYGVGMGPHAMVFDLKKTQQIAEFVMFTFSSLSKFVIVD